MLCKGIIIKDTITNMSKLKDYAIELKKAGPKQINIHTKKTLLFQSYNLYEDLLAEREWNETIFIAMDLFQHLISLNLTFHNYWTNRGKWKFRYLKQFDGNFTERITESFTKVIREQNKLDFLHFAKEILVGFGSRPKQYSSRYYSFIIKNGILTISIRTALNINHVYENYLNEFKNRLKIYSSSIKMFYIRNDGNIYDQSDYLIFIQGEDEMLNCIISPILLKFFVEKNRLLKDNKIIFSLNYYLEPHDLFINHDLCDLANPLLFHFNSIFEHINGFDEDLLLTYLTQLHLCIGSKLGFTIENYIKFNKFLFNIFIPFSIDVDEKESFINLDRIKNLKLEEYRHIFNKQKDRMLENYSVIFLRWGSPDFDYVDEYFTEGLSMIDSFYQKLDHNFYQKNPVPEFKLNQVPDKMPDIEKKRWLSLSEFLKILYSSILLSSDQKSYLIFSCIAILKTN